MTAPINTGGPAASVQWTNDADVNAYAPDGQLVPPGGTVTVVGLTIRDHFAAAVLPKLVGKYNSSADAAAMAYLWADAMLVARNERTAR